MNTSRPCDSLAALLAAGTLALSLHVGGTSALAAERDTLVLDTNKFTVGTLNAGNRTVTYRAYEGIVYVANPVDANQKMNIYVPAEYFEGKSVGGYNAETAPIFFPNGIAGYSPARPGSIGGGGGRGGRGGGGGLAANALARGMVVASAGVRGNSSRSESGFTGKAPACIVDLKAAVRYLRHNDNIMPGNAEKIISNGTSAGGAVSALLGGTGNSPEYEPYLKAIGAAAERDDIFAASCYCPITDLDHADIAYEWLFNGINSSAGRRGGGGGALTPEQIKMSAELKAKFPAHLNSLGLKKPDGTALTLTPSGDGSFKEYVKSFVIASAQKALKEGRDLSALGWITIKDGTVTDLDFGRFSAYATRLKTPPAFDSLSLWTPENNLFGDANTDRKHFTQFGKDLSAGALADPAVVKMMNPMYYIGVKGVTAAPHWRIRHGAVDRDTSLAVPVMLATKLQNNGSKVDFSMPWGVGHSGDYDANEFFVWVEQICR
jgi:hypothetical protein